jgi:hypothetical protein
LSDFTETLIYSTNFQKKTKYQVSPNPPSDSSVATWERKEGKTDGQTDTIKPIVAFSNFAKALKKAIQEFNATH